MEVKEVQCKVPVDETPYLLVGTMMIYNIVNIWMEKCKNLQNEKSPPLNPFSQCLKGVRGLGYGT